MIHYTIIRIDNTAKNRKLHKFATANKNFEKNQLFQTCIMVYRTYIHVYQFLA